MSFSYSQTPTGELDAGRVMKSSPINLASVEYILSNGCIAEAWKKVLTDKGASGVDRISIGRSLKWGRPKWKIIRSQALAGTYQPMPMIRGEIPKEPCGERRLGILGVFEQVFMQSIAKYSLKCIL